MIQRPPTLLELQAKDEDLIVKNIYNIINGANGNDIKGIDDADRDNNVNDTNGEEIMQLE